MRTFNKAFHPEDYAEAGMGFWLYLYDYAEWSKTVPFMPNPHIHRRWEYGMAMEFLKLLGGPNEIKSILDVGGAGSLFAPVAMSAGYNITVIDPDPCVYMLYGQGRAVRHPNSKYLAICGEFSELDISEQFDVVLSLSTIEHVPEDVEFVKNLQQHAKKGVFLTTDFSLDGGRHSEGHLRTYTPKTMKNKLLAAFDPEWQLAGEPEWQDNGPFVLSYNFASLGVINENVAK